MKPAPFRYLAPRSAEEALSYLAEYGYDAKVLAGGQSLVPTMNFRLAQPAVLVDLNRASELFYVNEVADGTVHLGAMTRQRTVEQSAVVARRVPLLHATMPHIAHVQIRNRGTIGGSLAHADPAAELPAVMVALSAQFRLRSLQGERTVAAEDFYIGLFTTDLQPDEILAEIVVPPPPPRTGWAFQEVARRHGDYALVGAAATVTLAADGRCSAARLIYFSVGDGPHHGPHRAASAGRSTARNRRHRRGRPPRRPGGHRAAGRYPRHTRIPPAPDRGAGPAGADGGRAARRRVNQHRNETNDSMRRRENP